MITVTKLTKRFGATTVLKGVSLAFGEGCVTAIVGPNGSGKTTLIKSILGLVQPEIGEIAVRGVSTRGGAEYRRSIGYMPQIARFDENLSAREIIAFLKKIRGNPRQTCEAELIELFELGDHLNKPLRALSGGTRQKVSAVVALMFHPEALILDEPTAGLDPLTASRLKERIEAERRKGCAIILTSHIMSEIEELADTIVFLLEGEIYFHGSVRELLAATEETRVERAIARLMEERAGRALASPHPRETGEAPAASIAPTAPPVRRF